MNPGQRYVERTYSDLHRLGLNVPEWQRLTSAQHVASLYHSLKAHLEAHHVQPVLPGCITLCHRTQPPDLWLLIDGQHRVLALKRLYDEDRYDLTVMCCDLAISSEAEAHTLFELVNASKPLSRLPRHQPLSVPNAVVRQMQHQFPAIFKDTDHPRRPHLNHQQLAERLAACPAIASWTADQVVQRLLQYNQHLSTCPPDQFRYPGESLEAVEKTLAAAAKKGCFLGLYKNYEFLSWCFQPSLGPPVALPPRKKKTAVPARLKSQVWKTHLGEAYRGPCYCCDQPLAVNDFHAAHVIPEAQGGPTVLSNLRPVCASCNLSCGTKNLDAFKEQLRA